MEIKRKDFLFCYDVLLHRKLKSKGIEYITNAISNANQRFWLYYRSEEVNEILKEHSNN